MNAPSKAEEPVRTAIEAAGSKYGTRAAAAASRLSERLRSPEGRFRSAWPESPRRPGCMDLRAVFPMAQAWLRIEPPVAEAIVRSALDAQEADGRLPHFASAKAGEPGEGLAWPLLAQAAASVHAATRDAAFAAQTVEPLARGTLYALRHFSEGRVHRWKTAAEALIPETWREGCFTADVTALLIAEIEALEVLAHAAGHGESFLKELLGRKDQLIDNLESFFWDAASRTFADRAADGSPLQLATFTALLPLLWRGLPESYRKPLLARLCQSRAFGLSGGVPPCDRHAGEACCSLRPPLSQLLALAALQRSGATREHAVLAKALRELPGPSEVSEAADALEILVAPDPPSTGAAAAATKAPASAAGRRKAGLVLAGIILLLLVGFAAGSRALEEADRHAMLDQARHLYAAGEYAAVIEQISGMGMERPAQAEFLLGKSLYRTGQVADAERAFRTAEALEPKLGQAWLNHALCLYQQSKRVEARRLYERIAEDFATTRPDIAQKARIAAETLRKEDATPSATAL